MYNEIILSFPLTVKVLSEYKFVDKFNIFYIFEESYHVNTVLIMKSVTLLMPVLQSRKSIVFI